MILPYHGSLLSNKKEGIIDKATNWMNLQERWVRKDWSHSPCKAPSNMWHSITLAILSVTESKSDSRSVLSDSATPWAVAPSSSYAWNSPGENTGVGCHPLLQGIFPTWDRTWVSCTAGRFFTFWAILLVRSKSLGPAHIQQEGFSQAYEFQEPRLFQVILEAIHQSR